MPNTVSELSKQWYTTSFRVRYQETDQMGVVYHANYLNWFEIGRTEMIRELGFTYREMEEEGVLLPVIDLNIQYGAPAHYDDHVTVYTRMIDFSPLRIYYEYEVRRLTGDDQNSLTAVVEEGNLSGERLVTGSSRHVWVNKDWRPTRLDKCVPKLYDALRTSLLGGKE
ncbi:acyl-CoA thioesterase [Paenibacillus dakarensis]|uniref:acyl-CoA thioesterase n=1 Tax=Paenibacillus dakarensis TaxID=1527293 RepID=UPI0006D54406|nr:thioesterase family protein [Paenibacillus dakarensis]